MGFVILRIRVFTMMIINSSFNLIQAVKNCGCNRWYLVFLTMIAAAGLMASALGCSQSSKGYPQQPPTKTEKAVPSVTVVKAKRMTLQRTTQGPGYIQAYEQTPMFAKIAGFVEKWHVDIGDHVSQGKVLAELWIPEMEVELKQKVALVAQADAELKLARDTVPAAEAEFRRAKSQHERLARLGQSGT